MASDCAQAGHRAPVRIESISLDGVPTLKITRGPHLLGYWQGESRGWLGNTMPSHTDMDEIATALAEHARTTGNTQQFPTAAESGHENDRRN